VRLRLTIVYGVLFIIAGAALLGITYALVAGDPDIGPRGQFLIRRAAPPTVVIGGNRRTGKLDFIFAPGAGYNRVTMPRAVPSPGFLPPALRAPAARLQAAANVQLARARDAQLSALLTQSGIALAIMAFVSMGLGWLMAGRALRPLRTMNARVRAISEHNLHERVGLDGHDDELKELGDAFDGLLERLEGAFESQRRFVANASHELRTPVTLERTLLEVALADPHADAESLRAVCSRVLRAGEQQERTINALLTLARSQRGLDARSEFDLAEVVSEVIAGADDSRVQITTALEPVTASGDRALAERLAANLVDNAVRYNEPHGWVQVSTTVVDGRGVLRVRNSGPKIDADQVQAMYEPFRRLNGERTDHGGEAGLGLSIVAAIARAHGAMLRTVPRPEGGLDVEVSFPPVDGRVPTGLYTA
jgi:signal transduction histidine kinase